MFTILFASLLSLNLQASEFFHQAPSSSNEYTVDIMGEYALTRFSNNSKVEGFDGLLSFQAERGFTENLAAGLWLAYGWGEVDRFNVDEESSGLEDIELYVQGRNTLGEGEFYYGLAGVIALEDREIESDNTSNRASGGSWARLMFGYEYTYKAYVLGFAVSQEFSLEDRITLYSSGGRAEVDGGEEMVVSFFMEKPNGGEYAYWGGEFSYTLISNTITNGVSSENTSPILRFKLYRPSRIASSMFIPYASGGFSNTSKVNGARLDEYTEFRLGLSYRF